MNYKILILIFVFSLSFVSSFTYYELDLNYDEDRLTLNSWEMQIYPLEKTNTLGFWLAEIVDFNEEILDLIFFDKGGEIFWDGVNPETGEITYGGIDYLENFNFTLYVPYYENAKRINIYDESLNEILEIDVSMYSKDLPVDYTEKTITQNQTKESREIIAEKVNDEKLKTFEEKVAERWWILGIVLVILIIVLAKSFSSRKNSKKHLYN